MNVLHRVVTRSVQGVIVFVLAISIGLSALGTVAGADPATSALCFLIAASTILIVLTLEYATMRVLAAIEDHPARFSAEIKSQRSESRAMRAAD